MTTAVRNPSTTTAAAARRVAPWAAAAVVLAVLPLTGGGAHADESTPKASSDFSGFSTSGYAAPVRVEIYEPTIPIPADPQAEVDYAYSAVKADSGSSRSRASYTWPGDAVGEGTKTILENLGVPLPDSVTAGGYPVQVNATYPGGPQSDYNEPVPGVTQRVGSGDKVSYAQTGAAGDGDAENGGSTDPEATDPGSGASPTASSPLDTVSGLLGNGPLGIPGQITASPSATPTTSTTGSTGSAPLLPSATAGLIDVGGLVSIARSTAGDDRVRMHSRSKASDIDILGGILQIGSVEVDVQTISNGKKATFTSTAKYGDMSVAGQAFTIGPDGVEAAGQPSPGAVPEDPAAMLAQLGIKITVPKPEGKVDGLVATASRSGLRIQIDSARLRQGLDALPLGTVADMLPDDLGQIKSAAQAAVGARPRTVLLLGTATASTETVKPLDLDLGTSTTETETPAATTDEPAAEAPAAEAPAAATGGTAGGASSGGLSAAPVSSLTGSGTGTEVSTAPVANVGGLPPLNSIPGALLYGGLALGALAGSFMRRLGLLALGNGGSCPHGLDSGLPDLRKA